MKLVATVCVFAFNLAIALASATVFDLDLTLIVALSAMWGVSSLAVDGVLRDRKLRQ